MFTTTRGFDAPSPVRAGTALFLDFGWRGNVRWIIRTGRRRYIRGEYNISTHIDSSMRILALATARPSSSSSLTYEDEDDDGSDQAADAEGGIPPPTPIPCRCVAMVLVIVPNAAIAGMYDDLLAMMTAARNAHDAIVPPFGGLLMAPCLLVISNRDVVDGLFVDVCCVY